MLKSINYKLLFILCAVFFSCKKEDKTIVDTKKVEEKGKVEIKEKLFTQILASESGIDFENILIEDLEFNYYQYMYAYIGAGIATADFDNDGLEDLLFISNTNACKLYKNLGNLKFEEIKASNIQMTKGFNAGVTTVDINNDGYLDIYITRGGLNDGTNDFENKLFVNNHDFTFSEESKEYGLNDANRGIQSTFFDYDNDNDLDVFVSNTPDIDGKTKDIIDLNSKLKDPASQKLLGSDKLYKNLGNGKFVDVSQKAGLHYDIGFGLNPQVGDLNGDGFLDVYVCNDFKVPDFAYINNGNGTFTDKRDDYFKHISHNSMGSDIVDINNDGRFDVLSLDMNPEDYVRSKTTMSMTSIPKFEEMVANNYHHQYMHNMFQLNNGNNTFSEISNMSGIANTDWSWSILASDFDLDGYDDVYVTNGVFRDVIDQDANRKILSILRANRRRPTKEDFLQFSRMLPQQKIKNYFFKNKGDLTFEDVSVAWSDMLPTFSNGAVYVDLDNDGDLEVVTNNINEPATILKNNAIEQKKGNFLKLKFNGPKENINGVGTKAIVETSLGEVYTKQVINSRGFLSSVSNTLNFGIPLNANIKNVKIEWLDGREQVLDSVSKNQMLVVNYKEATAKKVNYKSDKHLFKKARFNYSHIDPYFNDYQEQLLLPYKFSQMGPAVAVADVNADGIKDMFLGGGHTQVAQLLLGTTSGSFIKSSQKVFELDKQSEDISATFFDADSDGDMDLFVGSGSYEFSLRSKLLQDRLYINNGKEKFTKNETALPFYNSVSSVVKAADYDKDGDMDLFVGSRIIPGKYPQAPQSYLLNNEKGVFIIANQSCPKLNALGMVTDAVWKDINNDQQVDLIVTGEWMGIEVFLNKKGVFEQDEMYSSLSNSKGWWNKLVVEDIDNDGDLDIVVGNLGLNMKFHASKEQPFHVYAKDFDFNGVEDIVLAKDYKGKQVPIRGRTCTAQQMPHIAQKISTFEEFANLGVDGILGKGIDSALHYEVNEFRSGIFYNEGSDFKFVPFSNEVQASIVNSIVYSDFDNDGNKDLLLAGNNYNFEVETTRSDAGIGAFLKGTVKGGFEWQQNSKTGFFTKGDVRNLVYLKEKKQVVVVANNGKHQLYNCE